MNNESTPLNVRDNHFETYHSYEQDNAEAEQLINDFKKKKKESNNNDLNCTFMSVTVFILLGAIWGSAFSFSMFHSFIHCCYCCCYDMASFSIILKVQT